MKYHNFMRLCVNAKSENESFIRSCVASFCLPLNPTIEQIGDIKTAVSEAVTNCVVHAYKQGEGDVEISVTLCDFFVSIVISDTGEGIEDVSQAMQPFFTSGRTEERSGIGFTVMQAMMDNVEVTSKLGQGTVVTMKKQLRENKGIAE